MGPGLRYTNADVRARSDCAQSLHYDKDHPPKTDGRGNVRKWALECRQWSTLHDKMVANDIKGAIPKELRGLMLLGQLSGTARSLAKHVPQQEIEVPNGVETIIKAIIIDDPMTETQRLTRRG